MKHLALVLVAVFLTGCETPLPVTRLADLDQILQRSDDRHQTFGPTGKRLFTERRDQGLGIRGEYSYIHKADINDPIRLEILDAGKPLEAAIDRTCWYPSHMSVDSQVRQLKVAESKFITDDDVLVDALVLLNTGDASASYQLRVTSGFAKDVAARGMIGSADFYGVKAYGVVRAAGFAVEGDALSRTVVVEPGQVVRVTIAMAMAETADEATRRAQQWCDVDNAAGKHQQTYQAWFDENCPQFECDDPFVTKMYWYRWFVARHCLSRSTTGHLPFPYFFEGTREGHFPRLVAFSSPHIITEARWLRDPQYAFGQVRNHTLNVDDEDRFFISARIDSKGGDYNNWITRTAWDAFCVHPDDDYLKQVLPAMADDVLGTLARFDGDDDGLCAPRSHWSTGMEFQPSFWYFTDYDDTKPDAKLKRGDYAGYLYGNARAVASAYRHFGDEVNAKRFDDIAIKIRFNCLAKMWDDDDRFFYGVREGDDAKARTREVVGFYPFMSQLPPNNSYYTSTFKYLVDPNEFWTAYPPATASKTCPAYTPRIGVWPAKGGKRHNCMWNGPSWPHATSVLIDVAATALQDYDQVHITPEHFWEMFDRYTHVQFENDDFNKPIVHEYFDGETAFPEGVPDYFHSTYCDLVIKYLVGLQPRNDDVLQLRPIAGPFDRFSLRNVRYRGHAIDIIYNGCNTPNAGPEGLTVWVDGEKAGHRDDLGPMTIPLSGCDEEGQS